MVQIDQLFLVNKYYVGGFTEFRILKKYYKSDSREIKDSSRHKPF